MPKHTKVDLKQLSPEALIERFVTEAKLSDPDTPATVAELDQHGAQWRAFAAEIVIRGGAHTLIQLLDVSDNWVAQCAARALMVHAETKDRAMAALDRIADECSGSASSSANIARNMIRYGDPLGDPIEVEKRLAEIRARDGAK
jgi:hypothetical protein